MHGALAGKPTEHRYMVHWEPHADAQAFIRTCWIFPGMIVVIIPIRQFVSHYEYYRIVNHWVVVLLTYTMQTVCPHKQVAAIARSHLGDTRLHVGLLHTMVGNLFGNSTCCVILSH